MKGSGSCPAHVKGSRGPLSALEPKIEQELLGNIHIRHLQSCECDIRCFDDWQFLTLLRWSGLQLKPKSSDGLSIIIRRRAVSSGAHSSMRSRRSASFGIGLK